MNKKFLILLFLIIVTTVGIFLSFKKENIKNTDNNIYFFTNAHCPYCEEAQNYIKSTYPDLEVTYIDISTQKNFHTFLTYADKYNLDKRYLGTPLICIGDNYLLGWSQESEKEFDLYIKKLKE